MKYVSFTWLFVFGLMGPLWSRDVSSGPVSAAPARAGEQATAEEAKIVPLSLKERVAVTECLGDAIPTDLVFMNQRGQKISLGECLQKDKAVILNLVYFNCPTICSELMNNVVSTVGKMPWKLGTEFQMITVSIDPREGTKLSSRERNRYLEHLGYAVDHKDWLFLTGDKADIQVLADSVGYGFAYQKEIDQFAHPAVTVLLSPDGRVMRYLAGLSISSVDMKLGLVEAGEGKVGTSIDNALLRFCYAYDPNQRGYVLKARKLMFGGGALTVLLVGGFMFFVWRRELRTGGIK